MLIRDQLQQDSRTSLINKDTSTLAAIRLIISEQKRIEIDTRTELSDQQMLALLEKMRKQRLESISQFRKADRQDLIDIEQYEIEVIQSYLPEPLDEVTLDQLITEAIQVMNAATLSDMGKVMGWLKPKVTGRVDMEMLCIKLKKLLSS